MPLPLWTSAPREKDQWRLLTKLQSEAHAGSQLSDRARSAYLREDEHGH
jgi:hypothetical protein